MGFRMLREGKLLFLIGLLVLAILTLCPVSTVMRASAEPFSEYIWISGNDDYVRKLNKSDPGGTEILSWDTGTSYPFGCEFRAVDGTEYIYVADYADLVARYLAADGSGQTTWDIGGFSGDAYGLAWNGSKWFIADRGDDLIYGADWGDGSEDMSFYYTGIGYVEGLAYDGTYLWAVDTGTDYVYKLVIPASGSNVEVTPTASWDFAPDDPVGIAYDITTGHLWIVSSATDLLYEYYTNGTAINSWDPPGANPEGVAYSRPPDTTPPVWSDAGKNNTLAGQPTLFHVKWTDNYGLSGFIFGTNNTGTWANDPWTPMSGTTDWSNVTKTLNSTGLLVVQWRVWANDTSNNWNDTGILSLTTTQPTVALHPSTVSWVGGQEPATYPFFNLTVDVIGFTDSIGVAFSVHWNSSILNLTSVAKGDCFETGGTTQFLYVVDYVGGYLKDCVYTQIDPKAPKSFPATWGWVATLTFKFIGTSPTAGQPVDTDIVFVDERPDKPTYWTTIQAGQPVFHDFVIMSSCHFHYETAVEGFNLNLRVMDWDLIDSISGAYVYVNLSVKISDANGWANWTGLNGTVQVKVKWYGFWVNGTSVTMDSNKTIDLQCNIFDIEVTCVEGLQSAFLQYVNVTVYNASSVAGNMIRTGITGSDGKVGLANVPNATLTFTCYDGASPQNVIANVTRTITAENQTETIICDQNYISTTHTWGIIRIYSSALCLGLILLLGFAAGKPSRMLNCLKERIKKVRSKQKKGKEGGKTHESFNA
jgi:hypothetical protein